MTNEIFKHLKGMLLVARKITPSQPVRVSTYQTIIGEIQNKIKPIDPRAEVKDYDDKQILPLLKSTINAWKETLSLRADEDLAFQISLLESYLPVQLDDADYAVIAKNFETFPEFMKHLKEKYPNRYDGRVAKTVFDLVKAK